MTIPKSNKMLFPAKIAVDTGVAFYLSCFGIQTATSATPGTAAPSSWDALSGITGWSIAVAGIIYGAGRIVAQIQMGSKSAEHRLISDNQRLHVLEESVRRLDKQIGRLILTMKFASAGMMTKDKLASALDSIMNDDSDAN